jgi:hypothetical protein
MLFARLSSALFWYSFLSPSLIPAADACPVGSYGLPQVNCKQCPKHTTTSDMAVTIHDCRCEPGYLCMYYKQVHATVTLNTTLSEFENNSGDVRTTFISGMAAAAGVEPAQVHIHFVSIRLDHRRLLLSHQPQQAIQVSVSVTGSYLLSQVPRHLAGLHLSHSWQIQRRLLVLEIPVLQHPLLAALVAVEQNT